MSRAAARVLLNYSTAAISRVGAEAVVMVEPS